jgi:hypothetical protein
LTNFADILNKPADQIEKPKPTPTGTYLTIIAGPPEQKTVNEKPVISFKHKVIQAQDDVDQAALAEAGGVGKVMPNDFFLMTNDGNVNDWPILQFLENTLGIEKTGKSLAQMLAEAPGKQCYVTIKHEIYTDKRTNTPEIAARISGSAKV